MWANPSAVFDVIIPPDQAGEITPLTVMDRSSGVAVTISAIPAEVNSFRVSQNVFANALGFSLCQDIAAPGGSLVATFDTPIRQVRNLPVAVAARSGTSDILIQMYSGATLVGSRTITASVLPSGLFAEATANLDPGQMFDSFVITSVDSTKELAVGGFQFTFEAAKIGDLDGNGAVDRNDLEIFLLSYTGSTASAPFWAAEADLNADGHVDNLDYTLLLAELETAAPSSAIVIESGPPASLPPVAPLAHATYPVTALDLAGGTLTYQWTAEAGVFDEPTSFSPTWTAPAATGEPVEEVALTLVITSTTGGSRTVTYNQPILDPNAAEGPPAPELTLELPDGEVLPSGAFHDLGPVVNSATMPVTFVIKNEGALNLSSVKAKPVTAQFAVTNRDSLAARLAVSGGPGSAFFAVSYRDPTGVVTAGILSGAYRTAAIKEPDGPVQITLSITPNKKKLIKKKGRRTTILKKTFTSILRASTETTPTIGDSAAVTVKTR